VKVIVCGPTFHSSVAAESAPVSPPKAKAELLDAPAPPKAVLAVFKSPVSVQLVPFQDSVIPVVVGVRFLQKLKLMFVVPHLLKLFLQYLNH
jgi:hypothetical protein